MKTICFLAVSLLFSCLATPAFAAMHQVEKNACELSVPVEQYDHRDICAVTLCYLDSQIFSTWEVRYCVCDHFNMGYPGDIINAICGVVPQPQREEFLDER